MESWFLIAAGLCGITVIIYTLRIVPLNPGTTLSHHIARSRRTALLGMVTLPAIGILIACWTVVVWPPLVIALLLFLVSLMFMIMGVLPYERSRWGDMIHDMAGWGSVLLMVAIEVAMALWVHKAVFVSAIAILSQAIALALYLFFPRSRRYLLLIGQLICFWAFFAVLAAASWGCIAINCTQGAL